MYPCGIVSENILVRRAFVAIGLLMSIQLAAALEWITAENTTLEKFCQIDSFSWG
jgi:hypothetical protein